MQKDVFEKALAIHERMKETGDFLKKAKEYQEKGIQLDSLVFLFKDTEKNQNDIILIWPEMVEEIFQSTVTYVQNEHAELEKEFDELKDADAAQQ